jgi:hypothetical protein
MRLKREGVMTTARMRVWIAEHIEPLEKKYEEGERSDALLRAMKELEPPSTT